MSGTIDLVSGDQLPELTGTYTGVDITGFTIKLNIKYATGVLSKTATITNGPAGQFKFTWGANDLKAGTWPAEIEVTDGSGKPFTFQGLTLAIAEAIA